MPARKLIVNVSRQTAELWEDNSLKKNYCVSTARNGLGCENGSGCTPRGKLRVAKKIGHGLPFGALLRSRVPTGEIWSHHADNPLSVSNEDLVLTRILWLEGMEELNANTLDRFIYLHGTNQESLLGSPASHGCIRFSNADIIEVFEQLDEGAEVEIL